MYSQISIKILTYNTIIQFFLKKIIQFFLLNLYLIGLNILHWLISKQNKSQTKLFITKHFSYVLVSRSKVTIKNARCYWSKYLYNSIWRKQFCLHNKYVHSVNSISIKIKFLMTGVKWVLIVHIHIYLCFYYQLISWYFLF